MEKPNPVQEMNNLRSINRDIYKDVRNPYLKLFLILAIERDASLFAQVLESSAIDLFDYVTLACKYLDRETLLSILRKRVT